MNSRVFASLMAVSLILTTAWEPFQPPAPEKVRERAWRATDAGAHADVVVFGQGAADLSPAAGLTSKEARTRFVVDALVRYADAAQGGLRKELSARGVSYRVLWISNGLALTGVDRATLAWLGARADVASVDLDVKTRGVERNSALAWPRYRAEPGPAAPQSIPWGVDRVRAPQVWALGYTGQGIVMADLDTGVAWAHPALKPQYRGWNGITATHDFNWLDVGSPRSAEPFDDYGHGTHTTGTMVGDDGGANQVGVAPGARWIACKNMINGDGSVARYVECFQFALAPTDTAGGNPDPGLAADITNNSWGCVPGSEAGCEVPSALVTATQVLRDAGIMVVASAGNSGSGCYSVQHAPGMLNQAFSAGAIDVNNSIAGFSSRGPSAFTGKLKPNVAAPGVGVVSSYPGDIYVSWQGTSMAAPHVSGVAALLWSAAPGLRGQLDETEWLLSRTATPLTSGQSCGGVPGSEVPNNTFGYGLVNAQAVVSEALRSVISASAGLETPTPQPAVRFTLTVSNATDFTRTNVVITAALPLATSFVDASAGGSLSGTLVTWAAGSLAPRNTASVSFDVAPLAFGPVTLDDYRVAYDHIAATSTGAGAPISITRFGAFIPVVTRDFTVDFSGGDE